MRRLAFSARSQSDSQDVPGENPAGDSGTNSATPAREPEARTFTRQRPISPSHFPSTSAIRDGRYTRKLLPRCGVRSNTNPLESTGRLAVAEARARTISRSFSSINPSLKVRTFLPTPPRSCSGGWPKRIRNSSDSWASTVSSPITETTTLAEMSASSLRSEKSSLVNRHFSSLLVE